MTDASTPAGPGDLTSTPAPWTRWWWVPVAVSLVAVTAWWMTHPAALPAGGSPYTATATAGQPVYIGVLGPGYDGQRGLHISEVRIRLVDEDQEAKVAVWVCLGSSIGQSTDPQRFCEKVIEAEGATLRLGGGDQLMVSVEADAAATVELDPVELSYRDGLQWGTHEAGPPLVVEVVGGGTP